MAKYILYITKDPNKNPWEILTDINYNVVYSWISINSPLFKRFKLETVKGFSATHYINGGYISPSKLKHYYAETKGFHTKKQFEIWLVEHYFVDLL